MTRQQYVYFIQDTHSGWVKIGTTRDVQARLRQLQTANRSRLRLLGAIHGDATQERAIHRYLREQDHHLRGEWFSRDGTFALLRLIPADQWVRVAPSTSTKRKGKHRWSAARKKQAKRQSA